MNHQRYIVIMSRPRPRRERQQSRVGNLFGEMPAIQEQKENFAPMQQRAIHQSPLQNEPSLTTPPPPKVFKMTISHSSRNCSETPDIPYHVATESTHLSTAGGRAPTVIALAALSPAPTVYIATILLPVPTLGELDPNDYQLSRAEAA